MQINENMVSTPIVLRTAATIPAGTGLSVPVTLDSTKIQNTLRVPIEIMSMIVTAHGISNSTTSFGRAAEIDLVVGRHHMTDGFIPFPVLAPWNAVDDTGFSTAQEWGGAEPMTDRVQRAVLFPQPIRLAPGVGFSGRIRRGVTDTARTVSVTLIGKTLPGGITRPTVQQIPFWSATQLYFASGRTAPVSIESLENEFRNPFDKPLAVNKIIGATFDGNFPGAVESLATMTLKYAPTLQLRWPNGDLFSSERGAERGALFLRRNAYAQPFTLAPNSRIRATAVAAIAPLAAVYYALALFGTRPEVL